jgi:hypothetical protein
MTSSCVPEHGRGSSGGGPATLPNSLGQTCKTVFISIRESIAHLSSGTAYVYVYVYYTSTVVEGNLNR